MTKAAVVEFLHYYNQWRLGADMPAPDPKDVTKAIETAIKYLKNDTSTT